MNRDAAIESLQDGQFDFADFGCSNGESIKFGFTRLGGKRGLGIDKNPNKVRSAIEDGHEAIQMDVTALGEHEGCVSFVLMSHFLEHLPGYHEALTCIRSACLAARDYVLIRQPWFDSDGYLFTKGLKLYWSDWIGHTYPMSCLDLYRALRDCKIPIRYRIYGRARILNSIDETIHPISSPTDQHGYDPHFLEPKSPVKLEMPTFKETCCIILRSKNYSFEYLEKIMVPLELLHEHDNTQDVISGMG